MNVQLRRMSSSTRWPCMDPPPPNTHTQAAVPIFGFGTNVKKSGDGFGKARSGFRCSNTLGALLLHLIFL